MKKPKKIKYPDGQFQFEKEYCDNVPCAQCANPMLKGLHTCKTKKGKKNKPMPDSKKNRTKQSKLRDQEDKARNAKGKQDDFFAKLGLEIDDDANIKLDRNGMKIAEVMTAVENELRRAVDLHGGMRSCHEGYAVILEEVDELWEHVRLKSALRKKKDMRMEAIQIAAMAARFVVDLC